MIPDEIERHVCINRHGAIEHQSILDRGAWSPEEKNQGRDAVESAVGKAGRRLKMRKHKADQVLSLLLNRARVEAGGNTYCMREDHSLALVMPLKETSVEVVIGMDMDLKRFVDLCEAVPENELFIMAAQQALRELHSHG